MTEIMAGKLIDCITHINSASKNKVRTDQIKSHFIKKGDNNNHNLSVKDLERLLTDIIDQNL